MYGPEFCSFPFWWIVPIILMVLCFFLMRRRIGSMMCGFGTHSKISDSAKEILDRRYVSGEIEKDEYEEKKRAITGTTDTKT